MTVSELFGLNKQEPKKEEVKKEEKTEVKSETVVKEEVKTKPEVKTVQEEKSNKVPEKVEENKGMKTETRNVRVNNNNMNNHYQNRNNNNYNNQRRNNFNNNNNNNFNNRNNKFNNRNANNDRYGKRPLDEKGIEKNIKNIMATEVVEKENVREYNKNIDKQKNNNRFDENKNNKKSKNRRNSNNGNFDEGKLKTLKTANQLSNMFDDQDGGMLDYYDLTTERGRRGKKKKKNL